MSICNDPKFLEALRKSPQYRNKRDVELIYSRLSQIESLRSRSDKELHLLSTKVRYEFYPANSVLYREGESFNSWFVLISGTVFNNGSMFRAPATFGQQIPGWKYRQNQCYTLDASDLLVVDYDQHDSFTYFKSNTNSTKQSPVTAARESVASNEGNESLHSDYYSSNIQFGEGAEGMDSDADECSNPSSIRSSCPSLLMKDQALEALEKNKDERTEAEINLLHEFLQVLPAFNNLTGPIRRELCKHMVYVSVEQSGTVVMHDGEELDSWSVLLSGQVEIKYTNGDKKQISVGESFGVTPTLEKQYHQGVMITIAADAQFVCIEQAQYYDVLHRGKENMVEVLDPNTGHVIMIHENRQDGLVAIRGTPQALLTNLLEHESKADRFFIEDFLLTSRIFLKNMRVIGDELLSWFEQPAYREKVTRVVSMWVNEHFCDFDSNRDLLNFLEKFETRLEEKNMPQQRDLLHLVCESRPRDREINMTRKNVSTELWFEVKGGADKGFPLFISRVDGLSPADNAGLKKGDMLLQMNNQNFENMTYDTAMATIRRNTDMKLIVRTNLFGYKKMLSELNGSKLNSRVIHEQKEHKKSAKPKIFTSIFGKSKTSKSMLPNLPKHTVKPKTPSHDSGSADNDQNEFQGYYADTVQVNLLLDRSHIDLPDIEAIKVFRSDQTYKYVSITKETTAREAVRAALIEFGFSDVESQNESRFSLCKVTCLDVNFVKQTRLPDPLSDLASKLTLSDRYYLKDLTETTPLVPDAVVPELVKESHISFLDLDTYELAYQLSVRDYSIFRSVLPTDYIIDTFTRKSNEKSKIENMNKLEDLVNDEMFWVMHEVCQETNVSRRLKCLKHFISIAVHLKNLKNYNSMFAVLSGLGAGPVRRLQQTWKLLPSKMFNQFKELESFMDPSRNMSKYRCMKADNAMPPLVPFVPVIKKDLTFLHLGNDTKVDSLLNFEKMRMIAREIRTVRQYCEPTVFINSYSPNKNVTMLVTNTNKKSRGKQDPERIYRESSAARKVKQYLDIHWDKIIKDEDRLRSVSKSLEPPPGPNSASLSRKSNGDALSVHSSPGATVRSKQKSSHSRAGSEPSMQSPRMATVTVTKGYSRQMVPVSELPKFGAEDTSKLNKILSLAEPPGVSRYGERRRHKSGQSDSSITTASTSHTNHSAPIHTNQKLRKARVAGLPPTVALREHRSEGKNHSNWSRPVSDHFGTLHVSPQGEIRVRQKSEDSTIPSISENTKSVSKSSKLYHRSTPDLLQAPLNPIYQQRERDLSFITKI